MLTFLNNIRDQGHRGLVQSQKSQFREISNYMQGNRYILYLEMGGAAGWQAGTN